MKNLLLGGAVALVLLNSQIGHAQDVQEVLKNAAQALGSTNLQSIQYSGTGANFAYGQPYSGGAPWPRFNLKKYIVAINYDTPAERVEFERALPRQIPPPGVAPSPYIWKGGGGAPPFVSPQRPDEIAVEGAQFVSGNVAWNVLGGATTPAFGEGGGAAHQRLLDIWMSPYGVIRAAEAAGPNATIRRQGQRTLITFPVANTTVTATLNAQNLIERVTSPVEDPVIGDTLIDATYSGYRDFNGLKFPTHIVTKQGGFPTLELTVADVNPNATVNIDVPASVTQAAARPAPGPPQVQAVKLADGVYRMQGRGVSHHSVAVEFKDYVVVIEGGQGDELALPIIDTVNKLFPNKPIKYVVNTHVHFDHAGGLRAFIAKGVTVITQASNQAWFLKVWAQPHTIQPDYLALHPKEPIVETVDEKQVITDGNQQLELYHFKYIWHTNGMLAAYLPKDKILVVPDMFEGPPQEHDPPNPDSITLYNEIQRLKLDVVTISPLHTPTTLTMAALREAIGKEAAN